MIRRNRRLYVHKLNPSLLSDLILKRSLFFMLSLYHNILLLFQDLQIKNDRRLGFVSGLTAAFKRW